MQIYGGVRILSADSFQSLHSILRLFCLTPAAPCADRNIGHTAPLTVPGKTNYLQTGSKHLISDASASEIGCFQPVISHCKHNLSCLLQNVRAILKSQCKNACVKDRCWSFHHSSHSRSVKSPTHNNISRRFGRTDTKRIDL